MSTTTTTAKRGIIGQVGYWPKGQTDHHFLLMFFSHAFYADNYVMKITFFPLKIVMLKRFLFRATVVQKYHVHEDLQAS